MSRGTRQMTIRTQTDNYGLAFDGKYTWSANLGDRGVAFSIERSEIDSAASGIPPEESTTNWGLEFYGLRKGQVEQPAIQHRAFY